MSKDKNKNKPDAAHNAELSVSDADKKADKKSEKDCIDGIMSEARKLYFKETHSIQQLLAFARQLDKHGYYKKKED